MANLLISEPVSMFLLGVGLVILAWFGRIFLKNIARHKPYYLIAEVVLSILFVIAALVGILALCRLLMHYRAGENHYPDIKEL